jgi:hypothetical protein
MLFPKEMDLAPHVFALMDGSHSLPAALQQEPVAKVNLSTAQVAWLPNSLLTRLPMGPYSGFASFSYPVQLREQRPCGTSLVHREQSRVRVISTVKAIPSHCQRQKCCGLASGSQTARALCYTSAGVQIKIASHAGVRIEGARTHLLQARACRGRAPERRLHAL